MVVEEYSRQSLRSFIRMCNSLLKEHHPGRSGGKSSMDIRVRFTFYQLVKAVKFLHDQGLCAEGLASDRIHVDSLGWITLPPVLGLRAAECAERCAIVQKHALQNTSNGAHGGVALSDIRPVLVDWMESNDELSSNKSTVEHPERPPGYYEPLTSRWLKGQVCFALDALIPSYD